MEVLNKPKLIHLALGDTFKILRVEGGAGTKMPPHYSTLEAIIIVQEGEAMLQMPDGNHFLKKEDCFIIPAKKEHTLTIKKDFKAIAVMAVESEINFI
ncbi:cupin domain-containing protein [Flavobacteriaceae bacterium KMM 6897]|nr:cupin domain-containing protein [Flavobacteriaceae bacterium KMM 6897]MEB8346160.1 cupin domain-containing protein [Flavobacteriaceae bacterium KMM 6898]